MNYVIKRIFINTGSQSGDEIRHVKGQSADTMEDQNCQGILQPLAV